MATPTYAQVIAQINTFIVTNGNNEITANVLNPILVLLTDFTNNTIGDLNTLTTDQKDTIVNAINSLKNNIANINNNGVQLHTGVDDPNITPPASYKPADFYLQIDQDSLPVMLWQFNGDNWENSSGSSWGGITGNIDDQLDLKDKLDVRELLANKQNNLDPDGTGVKYPTVDAVNGEFDQIDLVLQALVDAVGVHPTYVMPTSSLNIANTLFEIGQAVAPSITQTFTQNDAGAKTSETIRKNGATVSTTNTFTESYNGVKGIVTYDGTVSYSQGAVKNNNLGVPDPVGRIPAGTITSPAKTYEFVYPLFATTSSIATLTKQPNISMVSGNNIVLVLVAESGGNKQKIDIPDAWLTDRPLVGIQQLNTVSGLYEYPLGSASASLTLWTVTDVTQTIQGVSVGYKRRTYNSSDRAGVTIKLIF